MNLIARLQSEVNAASGGLPLVVAVERHPHGERIVMRGYGRQRTIGSPLNSREALLAKAKAMAAEARVLVNL
jgi:hypothetical protein